MTPARLDPNLFQPSFALKQKTWIGARVIKRYYPPALPAARVLAHAAVENSSKKRLRRLQSVSDPVALIAEIPAAQVELGNQVDRRGLDGSRQPEPTADLERFTTGPRIAWSSTLPAKETAAASFDARRFTRADRRLAMRGTRFASHRDLGAHQNAAS